MSLEDQIGRRTNEIILQRDAAQKQAERDAANAKYYQDRSVYLFERLEAERRTSAALRGVITRMKAKQGERL